MPAPRAKCPVAFPDGDRLTDAEITQIRARVRPLMLAYNAVHWDWVHLGLADLLDALTTELPLGYPGGERNVDEIRADLGEKASFYAGR